jgi:hypothetical protein
MPRWTSCREQLGPLGIDDSHPDLELRRRAVRVQDGRSDCARAGEHLGLRQVERVLALERDEMSLPIV